MPGATEALSGTWVDWVIEMRMVFANGQLVKSGSKVVKSVAGYDLHKLMIGARNTLAVPIEFTLRTVPIMARPTRKLRENSHVNFDELTIQRVPKGSFEEMLDGARERWASADPASGTMWARYGPNESPQRFPGDWVMRCGVGDPTPDITNPTQITLMKRAKDIFDPTHKLNPGELGIF